MAYLEDAWVFFTHMAYHHPKIYDKIHKLHHEFKVVITPTSELVHPIEYITTAAATLLSSFVLGNKLHFFTQLTWISVRLFHAYELHSGIEVLINPLKLLPFGTVPSYHDFHHSHNVGNYGGFFSFWD